MIELPPLRSSWIVNATLILLPISRQQPPGSFRFRSRVRQPRQFRDSVMFVYINIPNTAITGSVTFPSSGLPRGKVRKIEASIASQVGAVLGSSLTSKLINWYRIRRSVTDTVT
ncbi:hypothetical protein ACEPAI_3505 [Sanghuangporus weigelae]